MIEIVADRPVHLRVIEQAGQPVILGFHPIVTIPSGEKK